MKIKLLALTLLVSCNTMYASDLIVPTYDEESDKAQLARLFAPIPNYDNYSQLSKDGLTDEEMKIVYRRRALSMTNSRNPDNRVSRQLFE